MPSLIETDATDTFLAIMLAITSLRSSRNVIAHVARNIRSPGKTRTSLAAFCHPRIATSRCSGVSFAGTYMIGRKGISPFVFVRGHLRTSSSAAASPITSAICCTLSGSRDIQDIHALGISPLSCYRVTRQLSPFGDSEFYSARVKLTRKPLIPNEKTAIFGRVSFRSFYFPKKDIGIRIDFVPVCPAVAPL